MQIFKIVHITVSLLLLKMAQASVIPAEINLTEPTALQRLTQLISLDENGRRDFRTNLMTVNKLVNDQLTDLEFSSQSTLKTLNSKTLLEILSSSHSRHLKTVLISYDTDDAHITFGELLQTSHWLSEITRDSIYYGGSTIFNSAFAVSKFMKTLSRNPGTNDNSYNSLRSSINKLESIFESPLSLSPLKIHLVRIAFDEILKNSIRDIADGAELSHDAPPYGKVINLIANLNKDEITLFTNQVKAILGQLTYDLSHDTARSKRSQREAQAWYGPTLYAKILAVLDLKPDDYQSIRSASLIAGPQSLDFITFLRFCQTLYQGQKSERIEDGNILLGRNDCYPATLKILNDLNLPRRAQYEFSVRNRIAKFATLFGDPFNMDSLQLILIQKHYDELKQAAQRAQYAKSSQEIVYNFVGENRTYFAFSGFAVLYLLNFYNNVYAA